MNKVVILYASILLVGVLISSISQVMLKKAALKKYESKTKEYFNPWVIFAYILFFSTTMMSTLAYKEIPLSMGPVLESTSYIYVTFLSVKIFNEKINRTKLVALCMILIGITIFAILG